MNYTRTLSQWKKQYPGEWLALRVTGKTGAGEPTARLLAHHPEEKELWDLLCRGCIVQAYVTFAGLEGARDYTLLLNTVIQE